MAEYTGKNLHVVFNNVTFDAHHRTFKTDEKMKVVDASAGSDTGVTKLSTLTDGNAQLEMVAQSGTAGTAIWGAMAEGTEGTLEWGPSGTAAGQAKYTVNAIASGRSVKTGYNDVEIWTFNWEYSSTSLPTQGTY